MLSVRPAGPAARWAIATLAAIGPLAAAACTGKTHDLGDNPPRAYHFETPQIVAELRRDWEQWNAKNVAPLWHGGPTEDPTAPARPTIKKK